MRLHTVEAGEGPPIALLHGLFGRAQNLASVARRLAPHARVISIDLRNHGASPHAPGMDYETQANDVLETLAALHALPAAILGHSMGGKTAMAAALLSPASISRLLVADIAPVTYAHHNTAVAAALLALPLTEGLTRAPASAAIEHAVPDHAVRAFLLQNLSFTPPAWRIGLAHIAAAIADIEGWPPLPGQYTGTTIFVRGANSDYVLPEHQPIITALFPNADTTTVEGAGHWLHADQPAVFSDIAERFLLARS